MQPTSEQLAIAAFCEAIANNICNNIVWCALLTGDGTAASLDANIQAAIHASERLDELTKS